LTNFSGKHFRSEGLGVSITKIQNENLTQTPVQATLNGKSVHMAQNTKIHYVVDANYVLIKSEESGCT